jgi:two-component system, chemotaxis family, chemotaxis protein CheY
VLRPGVTQGAHVNSPTAVVIDDSATSRRSLRTMLTQLGFEVVAEGERGDQVLPLFEQHRPTVLTLDIVLPVVDGVTAVTDLLRKHPDATVVMCSSITARDKIVACRDAGVAHFVLKPFTPERLAAVARLLLAKAGNPASPSESVQ